MDKTTRQIVALEESHVFSPSLVNSARLGFNRNAVINYVALSPAINPASANPDFRAFPGGDNPNTRIGGGFNTLPAGLMNSGYTLHTWNSIQFYDDAFLTRGTHALKFGFALERMRYNIFSKYNPEGIWRFTSIQNFLTNHPKSLEGGGLLGGLPNRTSPRGHRQTLFGGYIQDDWRVRRNLTLNLGLRYEMTTVLKEVQGKLTNLRKIDDPLPYCGTTDPAKTTVFGKPGCTGAAPYYSNPTTLNFEPRFGFAWDPRGNGKMAVRGGFAIFDVLPLPGYFFSNQGIETPFYLTGTITNSTATPLAGLLGVTDDKPNSAFNLIGPNALTASFMEPNPKRNYVEQWNINFQRQITPSLTATVGYVGSHGVHMIIRGDDFDMVLPCPNPTNPKCSGVTPPPGRYLWPAKSTPNDRINPNFGTIRGLSFGTDSSYKALEVNIQKRMSHGFRFGGGYTYSKSMDDNSSTVLGDAFSNSITTWFWFAPHISRAVSDYNFTHSAVINGIWQVPVSPSLHGPAAAVLRGWELGSILKLNSGVPTTPLIDGDPLGVGNNGSDTFGIPDRVPGCDPVNHNYKSNPPGPDGKPIFLGYINYSCFTLPQATSAIASQCAAFSPSLPGTCSNLLGNAGRNSIIGPALFNFDFSVYKNFPVKKISESGNVQFRAEFFNILNHPNFAPPLPFFGQKQALLFKDDGTSTNKGGLEATVTQPRDIQFALKVIW